ncbi:uncharacterized protein LOC117343334 [Pecten maximus]|uniref:uncharacterized protein LOC117343334 n=1 Tax=Pecten maximus TaxID=6579 RepID=UPI0014585668|nr:uncharacterized protein LOC117343334 [Pecten maximus]
MVRHMTSDVNMDSSVHVISIIWAVILISLSSPVQSDVQPCVKKGPCTCETPSFTVDLTPLSTRTQRLLQAKGDGYTYVYSPCIPTGQRCGADSSVTDIAICQETQSIPPSTYVVGTQSTVKFSGSPEDGSLQLEYSAKDATTSRIGQVSVICSDEEASFALITTEQGKDSTTYKFQLKTKYACNQNASSGLSPGSVLLIMVL